MECDGVLLALAGTAILAGPTAAVVHAADPVIFAAGDIACAPGDPDRDEVPRDEDLRHHRERRRLEGLALGDLQYNSASLRTCTTPTTAAGAVSSRSPAPCSETTRAAAAATDYFNGSGVNNGPAGERGKGYYSYDVGAWHLIALNSNCGRVSLRAGWAQEQWLRADLAANPKTCTLAYWHHPASARDTTATAPSCRTLEGPLRRGMPTSPSSATATLRALRAP